MDIVYSADDLRSRFSFALSEMYREEVPLYGTLLDIVREVDALVMGTNKEAINKVSARHEIERHGAVRLGTEEELFNTARLFRLFGMSPVGYYDLSIAGLPLHATAFRPITTESLDKNPFRVFTSVLRKDMIDAHTLDVAERILKKRNLFTPRLMEIIQRVEAGSLLDSRQVDTLIEESLTIFKWHACTHVTITEYNALQQEHPVIADIVCFPSAHINHLTPRTLDIDLVQRRMIVQGMPAKADIEGPPARKCPILLRQTSFKALAESISFEGDNGKTKHGVHSARFGEVEQRGAAVTQQGRALYDRLLRMATEKSMEGAQSVSTTTASLFAHNYPDNWQELHDQGLVFFRYRQVPGRSVSSNNACVKLKDLVLAGIVSYDPIAYEDFLPISAVGIFTSNIPNSVFSGRKTKTSIDGRAQLIAALGCSILDPFALYAELQEQSLRDCERALCIERITL